MIANLKAFREKLEACSKEYLHSEQTRQACRDLVRDFDFLKLIPDARKLEAGLVPEGLDLREAPAALRFLREAVRKAEVPFDYDASLAKRLLTSIEAIAAAEGDDPT